MNSTIVLTYQKTSFWEELVCPLSFSFPINKYNQFFYLCRTISIISWFYSKKRFDS